MPEITTQLARIQTDPNSGVNPIATAFFSNSTEVDGIKFEAPWSSVSWPLAAETEITLGDVTMTYAQVSAFVVAIAYQEQSHAI